MLGDMLRYIRVAVDPGFYGERTQTASQYFTHLIVDTGVDGTGRNVIAKCVESSDADFILNALNT